jgi:hypothetical protein
MYLNKEKFIVLMLRQQIQYFHNTKKSVKDTTYDY